MRIRIEGDAGVVYSFLKEHRYPCVWTEFSLDKLAIKVRIEDDSGDTAGFAWATWHDDIPYALDFHVCIAEDYRGRWLSREVWSDLVKLSEFLGAEVLITRMPNVKRAPLVKRLLISRFGFEEAPNGALFKLIGD